MLKILLQGWKQKSILVAGAVVAFAWVVRAQPAVLRGAGLHAPKDVYILRSDERTLLLEFRPVYSGEDTVGGTGSVRLHFLRMETSVEAGDAGKPDLGWRSFPLAFPSVEGNSVEVVSADYEEIHAVKYAAVPHYRMKEGFLVAEAPVADRAEYARNEFLPVEVARLSVVRRSRSMLLGRVLVSPVQYNPATETVRKYSRIVIEVRYGASGAPRVKNNDDQLFGNLLLNYSIGRNWKTAPPGVRPGALSASVLATGSWYRLTVSDQGVYKLDANYLSSAGIDLATVDPRTIKIYGNGGKELSEDITAVRPVDLVENAIYVQGESDGKFDSGDYVLFYGTPTSGWTYDPADKTMFHRIHHYGKDNYYWLTFGGGAGKRMADEPSMSGTPDMVVDQFREAVFLEDEQRNLLQTGKDWVGQNLDNPGSSFTYRTSLPGLVPGKTITYRFTFWNGSRGGPSMDLKESGTLLGRFDLTSASPGGFTYQDFVTNTFTVSGSSSLSGNASQLSFVYNGPTNPKGGYVDWFEILYPRMLWGENEYLHFWSPDTTGVVEYRLQQFSALPWVLNVTDPQNVRLVSGVGGSYQFRAQETAGRLSEYCAAGTTSWKVPKAVTAMPNENLRGYAGGADYIILTASDFRSAADRLAAYRRQPSHGNLNTVVVDVGQIYNEFSGGVPDVTAIRDFLYYAYQNWAPQPKFVLFFGEASYDYKGILGTNGNFVPTWESANSTNEVGSYCTDDYFAKFGSSQTISLVLGRINSRTAAEADALVTKLIRYEDNPVHDNWKQRMLFVGDDAWSSENGYEEGTIHSDAAETLSSTTYTPDEFEKKKIYIAEYPTVLSALGRRKPGAYQDIITQINQGVLVFNYSGHGNEDLLAHEDIFDVHTSLPQLTNADKFVYFFLATCDFSHYDDPSRYTGSEALLNVDNAGAIGVISAARKVYATDNAALNQGIYEGMFRRDAYGRLVVERPATALYLYKSVFGSNGVNDQKFLCMGDPAMRLQYPSGYASIDSINGERVDSVNGAPRTVPVHVRSLSTVNVAGTIRDANNVPDASAGGTILLSLSDASHVQTIVDFIPPVEERPAVDWPYLASGSTIFRGESSIAQGKFRATFVVPKDIASSDSTSRGRLEGYFFNEAGDGAAYTGAVNISGTDSLAVNNGRGPSIAIYLGGRNFHAGDVVTEDPVMYVDLMDSSGINTSVSGIGHRIEAWVNNSAQSQDLTSYYSSKLDNFREGTVQYQLRGLPVGNNAVRVRAWDSFNNSATAEATFRVASGDQLQIFDVLNYPNPFSSGTSFTFRQNQGAPINVKIKIYTVAGRLIQTLRTSSSGDSFVRVPWDGRDRDGAVLANGVYLYKIVVSTADQRFTSEAVGKLAVLK